MKSKPASQADPIKLVLATKAPPALIRKLDISAKKSGRTRSGELRARLAHSLKNLAAV
jgi:hypothetical protein